MWVVPTPWKATVTRRLPCWTASTDRPALLKTLAAAQGLWTKVPKALETEVPGQASGRCLCFHLVPCPQCSSLLPPASSSTWPGQGSRQQRIQASLLTARNSVNMQPGPRPARSGWEGRAPSVPRHWGSERKKVQLQLPWAEPVCSPLLCRALHPSQSTGPCSLLSQAAHWPAHKLASSSPGWDGTQALRRQEEPLFLAGGRSGGFLHVWQGLRDFEVNLLGGQTMSQL